MFTSGDMAFLYQIEESFITKINLNITQMIDVFSRILYIYYYGHYLVFITTVLEKYYLDMQFF
ncbi:hypothetical protein NIES2109_19020 [Nostoc sp. HK-01]|uniref:Uncharacterized protein n=1 Tax=Anabaenopsis circularis NIES-21 TaxID=1085406 RepID=A0A1Z4GGY3_9CYAN|nr:hypothetical protein NIES21_26030 [Anabaenopsis circularis NIES-21]BBD59121.1 hypothetical protein NIES2109_19020 [Nostoc sp. HK-01]